MSQSKVKAIPEGYHSVTPYLVVDGGARAIDFYKRVFGAKLTFDGRDAGDAYRFLAERGVNAPAGNFYALEPSRWLGLGDTGGLRAGLAPYTDDEDVDRLLAGLADFLGAR